MRAYHIAIVCAVSAVFASARAVPAAVTRGSAEARVDIVTDGDLRTYRLTTTAELRDGASRQASVAESVDRATVRSGDPMFDGLFALAVAEAKQDSVHQISDSAYDHGRPIPIDAFQTGESWRYVWTRDLSYSVELGLAQFDPGRAVNSLLFKSSDTKPAVAGSDRNQIVQDTGSGGSYPVSTDRVVWALGVSRTLDFLSPAEREPFARRAFPTLCDTAEQDRRLAFDARTGLYRGEQSFLDWREQTYPGWTKYDVLPIAMSKALSTNALHYHLLRTTADLARRVGRMDLSTRYDRWADALKLSINDQFFDAKAGLYATYLLSDGVSDLRVDRYDLLGECLTILFGIADPDRATTVIAHYPTGPHGPPVVWPQERSVPIYHNQAMWPFVTAYWARAAAKVGNGAAVDAAVRSLYEQSALNLSNMENYDLVTGRAQVSSGPRQGPVINSRRQLWSVAGYLSMVQDVVFGADVSREGIRFRPCITAGLGKSFAGADGPTLRHFAYGRTSNTVRIHVPAATATAGIDGIDHVELNGRSVGVDYVPAEKLQADNQWDVYLKPPATAVAATVRVADVNDERAICAPLAPRWAPAGLEVRDGHVTLRYEPGDPSTDVTFTLYRDGRPVATGVPVTTWTDPSPAGDASHTYAVVAVDRRSGNASHPTPFRSDATATLQQRLCMDDLTDRGGSAKVGDHFERWGQHVGDLLSSRPVRVPRDGQYAVRVEFANGSGPVNTGICCGVKRVEVRRVGDNQLVTADHVILPQSGCWQRWDLSSPVVVDLCAGQGCTIQLLEDDWCRNMSGLGSNARYTGGTGGGGANVNVVDVRAIQLTLVGGSQVLSERVP